MYDYMRRDKKQFTFMEQIKGLPIFIGDDIAVWYQSMSNEEWDVDDFPTLAPPNRHCFFDYHMNSQVKSDDRFELPIDFGSYCSWREPQAVDEREIDITTLRNYYQWVDQYDPKWVIDINVFWRFHNTNYGPMWTWKHLLNKDGSPLRNSEGKAGFWHGSLDKGVHNYIDHLIQVEKKSRDEIVDKLHSEFIAFLHITALSIAFLHCKNVTLEEHQEGKFVPHTNAQKRRGDIALPSVTYKTLVVDKMKKAIEVARNSTGEKGSKSLHFVRGHFHEYSEEKPLFGNPKLTGRYYIPFHSRGNVDTGIVVKDYQLKKAK